MLSTVVGSAVFASIQRETSNELKLLLGLLSILAAALAGLQTFLGYSERAERHRVASARYASVRRQLEVIAATSSFSEHELTAKLGAIQQELDSCAEGAPHVPKSIELRVKEEIEPRRIEGKEI